MTNTTPTDRPTVARYEVHCAQCYSGRVGIERTKRAANIAATSHGNAYGHTVHIVPVRSYSSAR